MQANLVQEEQGQDNYEDEGYDGFWAAYDQFEQGDAANAGQEHLGVNAQGAGIQEVPNHNNNQVAGIQEVPN